MAQENDTPHPTDHTHPEENKSILSRRKFLATSAAGAGILALPNLACATTGKSGQNGSGGGKGTGRGPTDEEIEYATQPDTWVEPWEFVQKNWPGQSLQLDVVEHAAPVALFGDIDAAEDANVGTFLFSWNGISPAPTMRVGGNETLHVNVRNMLGPNDTTLLIPNGIVPTTIPAKRQPNPFVKQTPPGSGNFDYVVPTPDYCRPIHSNHKKQIRTTNIHFHGSHVSPYMHPDGTRSDDIFVRIIPQGDYRLRQTSQDPDNPSLQNPDCWPLQGSEVMGQQQYQYRLGKPGGARETHPPGTHWYHPHAHGSTFTQVAGGMAGLVIVEGDVDEYLKEQLTNPAAAGSFKERVMVIQRIVGPTPVDIEGNTFVKNEQAKTKSSAVFSAVNGQSTTTVDNYIVVAPEAVERWRVLNAGVDGQAYIDLMVLDLVDQGDLTDELQDDQSQIITWKYRGPNGTQAPVTLMITIPAGGNSAATPITWRKSNGTRGSGADILQDFYSQMAEYLYPLRGGTMNHLASDGITLVNQQGQYHTRPVARPMMISPANRMDFLFQAPSLGEDDPYKLLSIWIRQTLTGTDAAEASAGARGTRILQKIATIITRGTPTPPPATNPRTGQPLDLNSLAFPPVPDYLKPVTDQDITVKPGDPDYNKQTVNSGGAGTQNNGKRRGRRVIYSGWGGGGFPAGTTNRLNELAAFYRIPQEYNTTPAGPLGGVSGPESMMIDCRKFNDDPNDLEDIGHHMLLGTAEEWTVSNFSMTLFTGDPSGDPSGIPPDYDSRPQNLGKKPYASPQQKTNITTRAVDHPFHIHINPCWVVGIYDWEGQPLGWNYQRVADGDKFYPRWHDVIRLPRSGGYVVFRSRFWDFEGEYVNHCHILQHEDNGMMQGIAVIPDADQADYVPFTAGQTFPRPTWKQCYEMDWGLGGTPAQGEAQRAACIAVRTQLRKPS